MDENVHEMDKSALGSWQSTARTECTLIVVVHWVHFSALGSWECTGMECMRVHLDHGSALQCQRVHLDCRSARGSWECTRMQERAL